MNGTDKLAKDMTEQSQLPICNENDEINERKSKGIITTNTQQNIQQLKEKYKQKEQSSIFPALYKIVKDGGIGVWHVPTPKENDTREIKDLRPTLIRMIPDGVLVLCLEQDDIPVMIDDST